MHFVAFLCLCIGPLGFNLCIIVMCENRNLEAILLLTGSRLKTGLLALLIASAYQVSHAQSLADSLRYFSLENMLNGSAWKLRGDGALSVEQIDGEDYILFAGEGSASLRGALPVSRKKPYFVSFFLQGVGGETPEVGTVIDIDGAVVGIRTYSNPKANYDNGIRTAEIVVLEGDTETDREWLPTNALVQMSRSDSTLMSGAPPLTIRFDWASSEPVWDLFLGRKRLLSGIGLLEGKRSGGLRIRVGNEGVARLHGFVVSKENPLFEDENLNGVEDALESDELSREGKRLGDRRRKGSDDRASSTVRKSSSKKGGAQ